MSLAPSDHMPSGKNPKVVGTRLLMDAPRRSTPTAQAPPVRELSPTELLRKPTETLSKILDTLDVFVDELGKRATEGSISLRDVRALTDLVKAHATLRQTQLAEDQFARQTQTLASDAEVAALLIEAVRAGGAEAQSLLREALEGMEHADTPTHPGRQSTKNAATVENTALARTNGEADDDRE